MYRTPRCCTVCGKVLDLEETKDTPEKITYTGNSAFVENVLNFENLKTHQRKYYMEETLDISILWKTFEFLAEDCFTIVITPTAKQHQTNLTWLMV